VVYTVLHVFFKFRSANNKYSHTVSKK
jgi:hypothetical protein